MSKRQKTFSEKKMAAMLKHKERELEALCKKCGICCHIKIGLADGSYVVHPAQTCKYLTDDNRCVVYDKRFKCDANICFTRQEMIDKDYLLPEGCPYTKLRPGYKPARVVTHSEFDDIMVKELEIGNYNILLVNRVF